MDLDLKRLGHFLAVAEHGSLNSAARALGITQAGMTKSIRTLEGQVGGDLFERSPSGVTITRLGETLLRHARIIENQHDQTLSALRAQTNGIEAELRIGVSMKWALRLVIPGVLADFVTHPKRPRITIMSGRQSWRMIKDLQNGELDMALATPTEQDDLTGLTPRFYRRDGQRIVVRRGHPLDRDTPVSLEELAEYDWVRGPPETYFRRYIEGLFLTEGRAQPAPLLTIDSSELMLDVISRTDLIGVTTERMMSVQHANRIVMLDTPAYQERTTAILTRNEDILPVIADEVIEAIGKRLND
jgi:DNA-binding transcriptional LysR family regulator